MELNIDLKRRRGASIASTDTASSQHLEQQVMDHVHHKKGISGVGWIIGPGGGSRHGTGRDATGAIGTAPVIIGGYASLSISGGLSLLLLVSASGYASAFTGAAWITSWID